MGPADTIVAVSTPAGRSLRAVVRLSGPQALACAAARFRPDGRAAWDAPFRATRGFARLLNRALEFPAVLYVMRAPHSYTREDVVELHVPGSPALLDMILDDIVGSGDGVRLAEPGEFTRRAFLNGRIDLSQAEAVLAVVRARSEAELLAAAARLRGGAGRRAARFQQAVTDLRVLVEAALDFAEHGIGLVAEADFVERCARLCADMTAEASRGRGELASDGAVHAVICGPPNAGKSSLLNRLAGRDVALVHPRAGTTRDPVSAEVEMGGVSFRLTDTAGLLDTHRAAPSPGGSPDVEAVRRAREAVRSAQLAVVVVDGSLPELPDLGAVAGVLPRERTLCVVNKCDLPRELDERALGAEAFAYETVRTSALTGEGVDALREALGRTVAEGRLDASAADCLFNARQRAALRRAQEEVEMAGSAVREGLGYEFAAVNLREAADALGEITGQVTPQDVLDRIFSRFCIGK